MRQGRLHKLLPDWVDLKLSSSGRWSGRTFSNDAWTLKTVAIIEVCGNVKINQAKREKFVSEGRKKNIIKKKTILAKLKVEGVA